LLDYWTLKEVLSSAYMLLMSNIVMTHCIC